jgi:dihydropteroate synthase
MPADLVRDPIFGSLARALSPRIVGAQRFPTKELPFSSGYSPTDFVTVAYRMSTVSPNGWPEVDPATGEVTAPTRKTYNTFFGPVDQLRTQVGAQPCAAVFLAANAAAQRPPGPLRLMGIVNVTPDSFSDGGRFLDAGRAIDHGVELARQGAHVLDVGGESTRPGSVPIAIEEELRRTIPVVEALAKRTKAWVSIDTTKLEVARAALDAGATIVNDVSAGRLDVGMLPLVAERGATIVLMHMQGTPRDMQKDPQYGDVVAEVLEFLRERGAACLEAGIAREKMWVDPGIGFGKTLEHNVEILRRLPELRSLGLPLLVGVSRKAFIARIHGPAKEGERVGGTAAAVALAVQGGAEILRVHDVAVMAEAAAVARAISSTT